LSGALIFLKIREKPYPEPLSYHVGSSSARSPDPPIAGFSAGDNVDNRTGHETDQLTYTLQGQGRSVAGGEAWRTVLTVFPIGFLSAQNS
jgi:hypothetical protein